MIYNYQKAMAEDIKEFLLNNYTKEELKKHLQTRESKEAFSSELYDELWVEDSVTGNASGSYTFNTYKAQEYLTGNLDLLREAIEEFCDDPIYALKKGAEFCDVTIRCYLLGNALEDALWDVEKELKTN